MSAGRRPLPALIPISCLKGILNVEFWAKTTPDEKPGISVSAHMANVSKGCFSQEIELYRFLQLAFGWVGQ